MSLAATGRSGVGVAQPLLRLGLLSLSVCAALGALSAAGSAADARLDQVRRLLASRGVRTHRAAAWRGASLGFWIWLKLGPPALLLVLAGVVARPLAGVGLAVGVVVYLLGLAVALGTLLELAVSLGERRRGRLVLCLLLLVPEVLAPAWPALPTPSGVMIGLLDGCLRLSTTV